MKKEFVDRLTNLTNRSNGQTMFLLNLLDNDFLKLLELEEKLKSNHLSYCPNNVEECNKALSMESGYYKIRFK